MCEVGPQFVAESPSLGLQSVRMEAQGVTTRRSKLSRTPDSEAAQAEPPRAGLKALDPRNAFMPGTSPQAPSGVGLSTEALFSHAANASNAPQPPPVSTRSRSVSTRSQSLDGSATGGLKVGNSSASSTPDSSDSATHPLYRFNQARGLKGARGHCRHGWEA